MIIMDKYDLKRCHQFIKPLGQFLLYHLFFHKIYFCPSSTMLSHNVTDFRNYIKAYSWLTVLTKKPVAAGGGLLDSQTPK